MSARTPSASRPAFVAVRARAPEASEAERAVAEAWAAGASGLEERDARDGVELIVYAPADRGRAVWAALVAVLGAEAVAALEPVPETAWPEAWKAGLAPVVVSERLVVRPPFAAHARTPGQREVLIEPRQAFGTGAHATTALALEALDLALAGASGARVLDVGCGSGVLALAALALGAREAVACDLDPVAAREARDNAGRNDLAAGLRVFAGSLDALAGGAFDLVVANLIRSELAPLVAGLVAAVRPRGALVLSGLLAAERGQLAEALAAAGARIVSERVRDDGRGDVWLALTATR